MEVCRYYQLTETGFYYLQSRYYDPALGRFLNADSYASTGQSFLGYNMFAYCNNRPTTTSDIQGTNAIALTYCVTMTDSGGATGGGGGGVFSLALLFAFLFAGDSNSSNAAQHAESPEIVSQSSRINWGSGDSNHILHGSSNHTDHGPGWKKFNIDPDGNNAWPLVLKLLQDVVDNCDRISRQDLSNGDHLVFFYKQFAEKGAEVVVKIWEKADGTIQKLSDAWVNNFGG